jgi:hypothetical protein
MLLFDKEEMKRTLTDLEFDIEKVHLGYLTKAQGTPGAF